MCAARFSMYNQTVVGDNRERLSDAIRTALKRSDIVILTGGLGPTEDDLTKEVCAEVMELPLEEDAHTRARIEEYFRNNIYKEIPDSNWKQAMVPVGSFVLDNHNGTAPGLILKNILEKQPFCCQDHLLNCIRCLWNRYIPICRNSSRRSSVLR